ncbi:MAG: trypsin-like peptidase domain-containing protein [Acidobacteriota bacterium]
MKRRSILIVALTLTASAWSPLRAQSIAEMFKRVKDSVVVVRTTQKEKMPWGSGESVSIPGIGSGMLVDAEGLILTAAHVVQVAESVEVEFTDGQTIKAKVLSSAPFADVALLRLEKIPSNPVVAHLGDSSKVEVGEQIFIIGAPLGITHTLSVGHISARRQGSVTYSNLMQAELLQTDAAINPGNSGGPMFNMKGEVIGIVSHMITQTGGYQGLGFVITSNLARSLVLEGRAPWTGLEGFLLKGELARIFNLPQDTGILVQRVAEKSPAAAAGLLGGEIEANIGGQQIILGGDVVLGVQNIRLSDRDGTLKIQNILRSLVPGEEVMVTILRAGKQIEIPFVPVTP